MRFRYLLPAVLVTAGSVFAQVGVAVPNAIGVWDSSNFPFWAWYVGTGFPAGTNGNNFFQALPPEVTTYFGSQNFGGLRLLRFRGYEMQVCTSFFTTNPAYSIPQVEIHDAAINPSQTQRWVPGVNIFVTLNEVVNAISGAPPAGFSIVIGADLGSGNAALVPAGNAAGGALVMVWQNLSHQYGDGFDLFGIGTGTEPTAGGIKSVSYSGGQTNTGQTFILPNPSGTSSEYCWTWLFENSMIQPVKNARFITSTGQILGGGGPPAPFTFSMNDGRGAYYPDFGDAVSYNGNSKEGNPLPGVLGNTWYVPFVLYSGDIAAGDPVPEPWNSGAFDVHAEGVQKWIDDFCAIGGACPPGTGAVINPANSTYGMWLGLDLPFFLNFNVLFNSLSFADTSSGIQWAGPTTLAHDSVTNPLGLISRNPINAGVSGYFDKTGAVLAKIGEHRSLLDPQAGFSPVVPAAGGPAGTLGFGGHPGASVAGQSFGIQCWMLNFNTQKIVDVTNVAVVRL